MSALKQELANQYPRADFKLKAMPNVLSCSTGKQKWQSAVLLGLLFLVISAPFLYKLTSGLLKPLLGEREMADEHGHPSPLGMAIHAVVFVLIVRLLLR